MLFITERAVFDLSVDGMLTLIEVAPGIDIEQDIVAQMEFRPKISPGLKTMSAKLFQVD